MKPFIKIDRSELMAAKIAIHSAEVNASPLSGYLGSRPLGGRQCVSLEKEWSETFHVKHSVAVNSATSGILAACMAIGVENGDEVIVSPYTMSATAAAPKFMGAKPVFVDIDPETFCLDHFEVANAIGPKTKAVIVTNLFGHPAGLTELRSTCDQLGVYLIEDNAQAIYSKEHGKYAGTIGHIGVFSLNVHKHIQVGEGGVCCTDNDELANKIREAMNHGEMRGGILGLNLRMTEVTAAMAREQLNKLPEIMKTRWKLAHDVGFEVAKLDLPIEIPKIRDVCTHSFYCWAGLLKKEPKKPTPAPWKRGYLRPLYELPAFKQEIWLPVAEDTERNIILLELCSIDPTPEEITKMVEELGNSL